MLDFAFPLSLRCRSWFPRKMDSRCGAAMVRTRCTRAATSRMRLAAVPLMVSTRDRLSLRRRGGPRKMHSRDGLAHALAKCQTLRVCVQILQSRLLHRCRAPSHSPSALLPSFPLHSSNIPHRLLCLLPSPVRLPRTLPFAKRSLTLVPAAFL